MQFDFKLAWESLPDFIDGAGMTIAVTIPVLMLGMLVSIPIALAGLSQRRWVARGAAVYIGFFRGAPSLILLYFVYNGLAQLSVVRDGPLWFIFSSAYACAVIGFMLNHSGFLVEILRGAFMNVPAGVTEAAAALGLNRRDVFIYVRLPLAFRYGLKAYQNEVLILTKSTAAVSAITVVDLTAVANDIFFRTYDPITPLLTAAAFYWVIVNVMRLGFRAIDARLNAHLKAAPVASAKRPARGAATAVAKTGAAPAAASYYLGVH